MRMSRVGIIASASPGLVALVLFYSLAFHMRKSLGAWPAGIGEAGFPSALVTHAWIATQYFWNLLALSMLVLPVAILVCLLVPQWRHLISFFALYALVFAVCVGLMQLAPEPFLYWWID